MKYGQGPPDGWSATDWHDLVTILCSGQAVDPDDASSDPRVIDLLNRPRLWNGIDPHEASGLALWAQRQRNRWDAAIYGLGVAESINPASP